MARLRSLIGGELNPENLSDAADSWMRRADLMAVYASPAVARLDAAAKAVALSRHALASDSSTPNRVRLAHCLMSEGDAWYAAARSSSGAGSIHAQESSRNRYIESLEILNALKTAGSLPAAENAALAILANGLAAASERLTEAHDSPPAPGR